MTRVVILARRELLSLFVSPVAWTITFVFLLVMGVTFHLSLLAVDGDLKQLVAATYSGLVFWFMMLMLPPLISMRSVAEEKRSGSLEMLITTGISDTQVVVGKWLSTWCFFLFLWVCLLPLWSLLTTVGQVGSTRTPKFRPIWPRQTHPSSNFLLPCTLPVLSGLAPAGVHHHR